MAVHLDPDNNPLLRLYGLAEALEIPCEDGIKHLELSGIELPKLTPAKARALVGFLHRDCFAELRGCEVRLAGLPVLDFANSLPSGWFEWESIDHLHAGEQMSEAAHGALLEYEHSVKHDFWPDEVDPLEEVLLVFDELAAHDREPFQLRFALNKPLAVARHLQLDPPGEESAGPARLRVYPWYDLESFEHACGNFHGLLDFVSKEASRQPLALLCYRSVPAYPGDYLLVRQIAERPGDSLKDLLSARIPERLAEYAELLRLHDEEKRSKSHRLDLPPALFFQQNGRLNGYPSHPLFTDGILRPLAVLALLAWLAERVEPTAGGFAFVLGGGGDGGRVLELEFGLTDIRARGQSLLADSEGRETREGLGRMLAALAADIQRCAGREQLRRLWTKAIELEPDETLLEGGLWEALAAIHARFLHLEKRASSVVSRGVAAFDEGPDPTVSEPIPTTPPPATKSTAPAPPASAHWPDLELFVGIEYSGPKPELHYELNGPVRGYLRRVVGRRPLEPGADGKFDNLTSMARQAIGHLLPDVADDTWQPPVTDLEDWGRTYWHDETPDGLKEAYRALRSDEHRLKMLLISTDPSFPWELAKPWQPASDPGGKFDDPFWAFQFSLGRWLAGYTPPAFELAFERVLCVVAGALEGAKQERDYFRRLDESHPEIRVTFPTTKAEVLDQLKHSSFDVLHFACHGQFQQDQAVKSAVQLPGGELLTTANLNHPDIVTRMEESRPLVFLNACHTGRVGSKWTHLDGWAETFIDYQCGAFVGCGWEVADTLAARFSTTFYDRLRGVGDDGAQLDPMSVGDAVLEARKAIYSQHNSTWLAYYLYGNPGSKLR